VDPPDPVTLPQEGRVFRHSDRTTLADVAPSRRARLDALPRWLQDAAYEDVLDSGLDDGGAVWIVRRMRVRVHHFPQLLDPIEVATFCSGVAPLWAERSSLVTSRGELVAEAIAVWVQLRPDGARPLPLPAGFDAIYGRSAMGRRARARLRHPAVPPAGAAVRPWHFRRADLDPAGHVNNAVYWQTLEEELIAADPPGGLAAEIEHRAPAAAGEARVLSHGELRWITDPMGTVVATLAAAALG
jgi:acyl-ACP thioesterase